MSEGRETGLGYLFVHVEQSGLSDRCRRINSINLNKKIEYFRIFFKLNEKEIESKRTHEP